MNRYLTLLGATTVGFLGVVTLHGSTTPGGPLTSAGPKTTTPTTATTAPASGGGSTPATTTTGPPPSNVSGTATGQVENYGYGTMSVKVTVANGHIVSLSVDKLQTLESYSQQLEQQVVPIIKSEILSAQSTRVSSLTGATYTCEAYAYSVQSALDKLHFT